MSLKIEIGEKGWGRDDSGKLCFVVIKPGVYELAPEGMMKTLKDLVEAGDAAHGALDIAIMWASEADDNRQRDETECGTVLDALCATLAAARKMIETTK